MATSSYQSFYDDANALAIMLKSDSAFVKKCLSRKKNPVAKKEQLLMDRDCKREYLKLLRRLAKQIQGAKVVKNVP